jgi:hypothetical protein
MIGEKSKFNRDIIRVTSEPISREETETLIRSKYLDVYIIYKRPPQGTIVVRGGSYIAGTVEILTTIKGTSFIHQLN